MEALLHGLDQAALASLVVPLWVLIAGHVLTAVEATHGASPYWLVSWLLGFVAAYGGGTLSALLLQVRSAHRLGPPPAPRKADGGLGARAGARPGPPAASSLPACPAPQNPGAAAVALFSRNQVGVVYTLVWWVYGYLPGGLLRRGYAGLPPLRCAAKLCRAVLRATTVVQRVDAAARLHPGVVAAPVVLGTLAGAGGKLLTDAFLHCAGYTQGGCCTGKPCMRVDSRHAVHSEPPLTTGCAAPTACPHRPRSSAAGAAVQGAAVRARAAATLTGSCASTPAALQPRHAALSTAPPALHRPIVSSPGAGPNELSHPGYALRSAAVGACLQYLSVHVLGVLSAQQGLGLVITLYVAHSLATDLT